MPNVMRVFFSCSGTDHQTGADTLSLCVARKFREVLPIMLPYVDPFLFAEDITTGSWYVNLMNVIAEAKAGIIFVTKRNQFSPWIVFEAGAVAGGIGGVSERTMPLLINLAASDLGKTETGANLGHPLKNLRTFHCNERELFYIVESLNRICGENGFPSLDDHRLEQVRERVFKPWFSQELQPTLNSFT